MQVRLSELKANPAKYFDLARVHGIDIVVTRHGRRLGRIVCEERAVQAERGRAFDELLELVDGTPSVPDSTVYDAVRETRLREKGLLDADRPR